MTAGEVGIWVVICIVLQVAAFALLPGRQGFWLETLVGAMTGLAAYALTELLVRLARRS